jgi:hypothetical protein
MSYYNVASNHPLIENSNEYAIIKKYVAIHSQDRDFLKFPNAASFEIELPEDMLNVSTVRLADYTFPLFYDTYSLDLANTTMTFKIVTPYNPASSPLEVAVLEALNAHKDINYEIIIQDGQYSGDQIALELTNRFNTAVTNYILEYFSSHGYSSLIPLFSGYEGFVIRFNNVGQIIWFGNRSDEFLLTNTTQVPFAISPTANSRCDPCAPDLRNVSSRFPKLYQENFCTPSNKYVVPNFYDYGLPSFLGLDRCDTLAKPEDDARFYYEPLPWLTPLFPNEKVFVIQSKNKVVLAPPINFYLDIEGLNFIDETQPFNVSRFTMTTNETNGVVNSAFAKI